MSTFDCLRCARASVDNPHACGDILTLIIFVLLIALLISARSGGNRSGR